MCPLTLLSARRSVAALGCILVASTTPTFAQGEGAIRGQTTAAANDSALVGVVVTLTAVPGGDSVQTVTDAEGRFSFKNVRPGEYTISTAPAGFVPREQRFVLEPREIRIVAMSLDLEAVAVDVQVTADAISIPSTRSPSSTTLTAERLDTMPAPDRSSLPNAIVTLAPGMIRGHDDFVHVRGHEIALNPFIDGVSFWENPHGVFSAGLSPEVIEAANVMTGGFSAEYGNRFGGVVDVVTKSGLRMDNDGTFSITGGEAGRRNVSADFGGHRAGFGYYLFGSGFGSDRFLSPPDAEAIHDRARGAHAFVRLDGMLGGGAWRAVSMGDGVNFEIPRTPADVALRPLAEAAQHTRQQTAIAGWTRAWSNVAIGASLYERWSRSRLTPAAGPLTAVARLNRELLTVGGKTDITRFAGRHSLKAGVDVVWLRPHEDLAYDYAGYRDLTHLLGLPHLHVTSNPIAFSDRAAGSQVSLYVQDGMQIGARVSADLGVRLDRYNLVVSATHASPRTNVAYRVGGGAVLHASYNHFFVPPPIEGVLSSDAGLTRFIREIGARFRRSNRRGNISSRRAAPCPRVRCASC